MRGYFWNTVLAINSVLWFVAVAFVTYSIGMMILAGEWRLFLLALTTLAIVSLTELVLTGLAHD